MPELFPWLEPAGMNGIIPTGCASRLHLGQLYAGVVGSAENGQLVGAVAEEGYIGVDHRSGKNSASVNRQPVGAGHDLKESGGGSGI